MDASGAGPHEPAEQLQPARWFYLEGRDERHGPVALGDMRILVVDRRVGPDTLVWSDGMADWTPARLVPALVPPDPLHGQLGWPETDANDHQARW